MSSIRALLSLLRAAEVGAAGDLVVLAGSCKLEAVGAVVQGIDLVRVFRRRVQALHRRYVPVFYLRFRTREPHREQMWVVCAR